MKKRTSLGKWLGASPRGALFIHSPVSSALQPVTQSFTHVAHPAREQMNKTCRGCDSLPCRTNFSLGDFPATTEANIDSSIKEFIFQEVLSALN